jgi:hypothetical protein
MVSGFPGEEMARRILAFAVLAVCGTTTLLAQQLPNYPDKPVAFSIGHPTAQHVILISIDGMHALDLANYVAAHPDSTLAALSRRGTTYTNAHTPWSDGAPGMVALATGGTPISTGILYSDAFDHSLSPPGSDCKTKGSPIFLDEKADYNGDVEDAGGGIDPGKMPRDAANGCKPVMPHSLVRVNNIFEIIHADGGRTAWADQHPAYADLFVGPSGKGLDDSYAPEAHVPGLKQNAEKSFAHDDLKVEAMLNWIDGKDHTGKHGAPVPKLFGMTFIGVSVTQKGKGMGYTDGLGTPSPTLEKGLNYTDHALGRIVTELKKNNLYDNTWIIVTAKHGQSPIDVKKRRIIDGDSVEGVVDTVQKDLAAHVTTDTIGFIWLNDPARTNDVVNAYRARMNELGIAEIYSGEKMKLLFNDPAKDPRVPDVILQPELGVIWAGKDAVILSEHGGTQDEDTNVALLVSGKGLSGYHDRTWVPTSQVAPLILRIFGYDKMKLQALQKEHTPALPGIF